MFDLTKFNEALESYKKNFISEQWKNEKYKWEAIRHFQDHWDIKAENFSEMLSKSLEKTGNLLVSAMYFPAGMIKMFAEKAPEEIRSLFLSLFDENVDLYERISKFKSDSDFILQKYGDGAKNHYQYESTISTYLWLRFPEKYYIYKFGEVKAVAKFLNSDYQFKKGAYASNIRSFLKLYDEICAELSKDSELVSLFKSQLTDTCFNDPKFKTLTIDFGFYISRIFSQKDDVINNEIYQDDDSNAVNQNNLLYNKASFLDEVYMTENRYDALVSILSNKKNIILQGAPGVGKTFTAKKLAYSIIGEKDDDRIEFVQFHQNYSYEDFMLGYKPVNDGFELKYGVFYQFCQKAVSQPGKEFFFIIDEINRGNMSKIFGELLMLIEKDYRSTYATLAYNNIPFKVPDNLYIIGMMNTADRSLAMIDYALRRRFSFFEIEPGFDSEGFIKYQKDLDNETLNELIIKVKELNKAIMKDKTLGKGFCIGHSYFCGQKSCSESWLRSVVDFDILPMLWEYWFDEPSKVTEWENALLGVFQ